MKRKNILRLGISKTKNLNNDDLISFKNLLTKELPEHRRSYLFIKHQNLNLT